MSITIYCYGDSNTYGYDPRSYLGDRYPPEDRWTSILERKTGWTIINDGMNGRRIPGSAISVPSDADYMILMLGTNDLLMGCSAEETSQRMRDFLQSLLYPMGHVILVAPPVMIPGQWVTEPQLIEESKALARAYGAMAAQWNIPFLDAGTLEIGLCFDGVHFTEAGHHAFAAGIYNMIRRLPS